MTAIAHPNHPLRLIAVFSASLAAFAIVAGAAMAALYIIERETDSPAASALPAANVELPAGMVLVRQVDDAADWESELGFAPVLPAELPDGLGEPLYYVQQPDAAGRTAGHVRYTAADNGMLLVLVEQRGTLSEDRPMRSGEIETTREHIQSFTCGTLVITAQLFFNLETQSAPSVETSLSIAENTVAAIRAQCG